MEELFRYFGRHDSSRALHRLWPRLAGQSLRALLFFSLLSVTPLIVRAHARTQSACSAFAAAAGPPQAPPSTHSPVHISAMSSPAYRFVCLSYAQNSRDGSDVYYSTSRAVLVHISRNSIAKSNIKVMQELHCRTDQQIWNQAAVVLPGPGLQRNHQS